MKKVIILFIVMAVISCNIFDNSNDLDDTSIEEGNEQVDNIEEEDKQIDNIEEESDQINYFSLNEIFVRDEGIEWNISYVKNTNGSSYISGVCDYGYGYCAINMELDYSSVVVDSMRGNGSFMSSSNSFFFENGFDDRISIFQYEENAILVTKFNNDFQVIGQIKLVKSSYIGSLSYAKTGNDGFLITETDGSKMIIIKINNQLEVVFEKQYNIDAQISNLLVDYDNSFYVFSSRFIMKFDKYGNLLFIKECLINPISDFSEPNSCIANGSVFIQGNYSDSDFQFIKMGSNGEVLFSKLFRYNHSGKVIINDIGYYDDSISAVGYLYDGQNYQVLKVDFDVEGNLIGSKLFGIKNRNLQGAFLMELNEDQVKILCLSAPLNPPAELAFNPAVLIYNNQIDEAFEDEGLVFKKGIIIDEVESNIQIDNILVEGLETLGSDYILNISESGYYSHFGDSYLQDNFSHY